MQQSDYIHANHNMWNHTAQIYRRDSFEAYLEKFRQPDFTVFDAQEQALFEQLERDHHFIIQDKDIIQLGCNNGREIISLKHMGAGRCLGVDLVDAFLQQGKELAHVSQQEVEFLNSNVYEVDSSCHHSFDIVYVTIGVLGWLPDLPAFFELVQKLLRPQGHFFLYDMHPILGMYEPESHVIDSSYFNRQAISNETLPSYLVSDNQEDTVVSYWFQHTLADVIGQCLQQGLRLQHFAEYPHDISDTYKAFEDHDFALPLSYSLLAQKAS